MNSSRRRTVYVYESAGEWSRALRRYLPADIHVLERRGGPERHAPIRSSRVNLWVVDDEVQRWQAEGAIRWRPRLSQYPHLKMAVVRPAWCDAAWQLRESGYWPIWDEFWQTPHIARLITRFYQRVSTPDLSVEQRIWNNLPWGSDPANRS